MKMMKSKTDKSMQSSSESGKGFGNQKKAEKKATMPKGRFSQPKGSSKVMAKKMTKNKKTSSTSNGESTSMSF